MEKTALEPKATARFTGGETMTGAGLITVRVAFEVALEEKVSVIDDRIVSTVIVLNIYQG